MPSSRALWKSIDSRLEKMKLNMEATQERAVSDGWSFFEIEEVEEYPEEILYCAYCKNEFIPDSRGACNSCGAPRSVR